jgi:hypothetical protein
MIYEFKRLPWAQLFSAQLAMCADHLGGLRAWGVGCMQITRAFSWFSYLNGDDLRAYCRGGGPDRYRIVYNATWHEQVRTYDITADFSGADLVVQVRGTPDFTKAIPLDDLLKPWRGVTLRDRITTKDLNGVRSRLAMSDFYIPPANGTRVRSDHFFWVVMACEKGKFRFNAWEHPSKAFAKVTLIPALKPIDRTGIAFNAPHGLKERHENDKDQEDHYELVVRDGKFGVF